MRVVLACVCISLAFSVFAASDEDIAASDKNDATYAELYGSCTRQTCPPGSTVIVTAKKDDTGIAVTEDGHTHDLLGLRKINFIVISDDERYLSVANVKAPGGGYLRYRKNVPQAKKIKSFIKPTQPSAGFLFLEL